MGFYSLQDVSVDGSDWPFQIAAGGNYYLLANSTCHGEGFGEEAMECFANVTPDPTFFQDLQNMTTYAPMVYSNFTFTAAL